MNESHASSCAASHPCGACCTRIKNISVDYGRTRVLENINMHIHCGELTALVGPNGGGKSTLLRAILGEVPYRGEIQFRAHGISDARPRIGYVPQHVAVDRDAPVSVADLFSLSRGKFPVWLGSRKGIRDE
ncbi:MAG: ATP-binding cassette domain-containing protein, partial [Spirochaetota bacterium]